MSHKNGFEFDKEKNYDNASSESIFISSSLRIQTGTDTTGNYFNYYFYYINLYIKFRVLLKYL